MEDPVSAKVVAPITKPSPTESREISNEPKGRTMNMQNIPQYRPIPHRLAALLRKKMVRNVATIAMVLVALVASTTSSQATATGFQYWGGVSVNVGGQTIGIPAGELVHTIDGTGYYINWNAAQFTSAAVLCDTSMRFTYGNGAYELKGNVHWGCSRYGYWGYWLKWHAPRGSACAELWAKNWRVLVARQCHYVYG